MNEKKYSAEEAVQVIDDVYFNMEINDVHEFYQLLLDRFLPLQDDDCIHCEDYDEENHVCKYLEGMNDN